MTDEADSAKQWSRPLRAIHLLLATAVIAQLFTGSLMRSPHPGHTDSESALVTGAQR